MARLFRAVKPARVIEEIDFEYTGLGNNGARGHALDSALADSGAGRRRAPFQRRAVPGLGGMWFPMPLVWSVLAVALAEKIRRSALPIGNAIEAAVMLRTLKDSSGQRADRRVQGRRKLAGANDGSLENLSRRGAYVVQPIRMAMVQPLSALGFVRGNRYGSFKLHDAGHRMLNLRAVRDWYYDLQSWAGGQGGKKAFDALSPLASVPDDIRKLIKARIIEGDGAGDSDAARRRSLAAFVKQGGDLNQDRLVQTKCPEGLCATHWKDLRAGCALIDLRNDALSVLRAIEATLLQQRTNNESARITLKDAPDVAEKEIVTLTSTIEERLRRAKTPARLSLGTAATPRRKN